MTARRITLLGTLASVLAAEGCSDSTTATTATTATAKPPVPIMTAVSAITQQGTVNQFVASTPTVRVTDASGQPVVGASVVFSLRAGARTITTGTDGTASVAWQLSRTSGTQTLVAALALGPTTTFIAMALPDTLAQIFASSLAALAGIPSHDVAPPPTIVALDEYSNPKPGVEVTFEVAGGIGTVTPAKVTTDSTGRATVGEWTLGGEFMTDTLIARVQNLPPVYFTARVSPPFMVSSLVSGVQHACAISNGDVYCWGGNDRGQVTSRGTLWTTPQPVALGVKAVSLSSGYNHTCAISNEVPPQAYCWGDNSFGQLGSAAPAGPIRVPVADGLAVVSTGYGHSCGLTPAGVAYCWGDGLWGQLGNGGITACFIRAASPSAPVRSRSAAT